MSDQLFTAWNMLATGASTARTLPDRLAEVKNVKDFGATGNGSTDDTTAIQSAINWTSGADRGVIFFPAGTYLVSSALTFTYANSHSIIFRGVGEASVIRGSVAGFIFDRAPGPSGNPGLDGFESLWIDNSSTSSSAGGIRWNGVENLHIRDMRINAYTGISCTDSLFGLCIQNVLMSGSNNGTATGAATGTTGILASLGGKGLIHSVDIVGFGKGIYLQSGCDVVGTRIEQCQYGIYVEGSGSFISAGTEGCDVGIFLNAPNCTVASFGHTGDTNCGTIQGSLSISSASWSGGIATITTSSALPSTIGTTFGGTISGVSLSGYNTSPSTVLCTKTGASTFTYSISNPGGSGSGGSFFVSSIAGIQVQFAQHSTLISCSPTGPYSTGSIAHVAASNCPGLTYIGCVPSNTISGQPTWVYPPVPTDIQLVNCVGNNTTASAPTLATVFNNLPGQAGQAQITAAIEGMEYDITNSNTATWGATAAAGGSNHVKVRYNGTNWTVVGA